MAGHPAVLTLESADFSSAKISQTSAFRGSNPPIMDLLIILSLYKVINESTQNFDSQGAS